MRTLRPGAISLSMDLTVKSGAGNVSFETRRAPFSSDCLNISSIVGPCTRIRLPICFSNCGELVVVLQEKK